MNVLLPVFEDGIKKPKTITVLGFFEINDKGCIYFVMSLEMLRAKLVGSSTGSPAIKRAC